MENLTEKQERAVVHYIMHGNKLAAYRHAYDTEGRHETIAPAAYKLFAKPKIVEAIRELAMRVRINCREHDIIDVYESEIEEGVRQRLTEIIRTIDQKTAFDRLQELDRILIKARKMLRDQTAA